MQFELDRMNIFTNFMPHNNYTVIIDYLEKMKLVKRKKIEY